MSSIIAPVANIGRITLFDRRYRNLRLCRVDAPAPDLEYVFRLRCAILSYSLPSRDSQRALYNRLKSLRDWVLTPLSGPGQNLPCPPLTTIHCSRSLCQTSARRKSPLLSMGDKSIRTTVFFFWPVRRASSSDRHPGRADPRSARPGLDHPFDGGCIARTRLRPPPQLP